MKTLILAVASLVVLGSPAIAAPKAAGDAEIPFVNEGGIFDWSAPTDQTLFIQGQDGDWYQATMMGDCQGMSFANRIGFDTGGLDSFDRFSNVIVDGQRCPVQSLTRLPGSPLAKSNPGKTAAAQ